MLLIQPNLNWDHKYCESPSTALLILGTLAKTRGHEVKVRHLDIDAINGDIDWADAVGITVNTFQVKSAREIAKQAKQANKRLIVGGPHAIAWGNGAVVGEGENDWLKFLGETPDINSLDDIPLLDYDLVDTRRFTGVGPYRGAIPSTAIMASRGCPFQCTFCNTPLFWGKKVRYRSPESVLEEVEMLHKKHGMNEIFFQDDTFNLNHEWAIEIFEGLIARGFNKEMVFRMAGRVNEKLVTEEYLKIAHEAGIWNIFYGIESGSQYMLNRMKKGITVGEIKRAVKMTRDAGITTTCSFIVGLPGENRQTLKESAELIMDMGSTYHGWCFFCPFPGTEAEKEVRAKGHIKEVDYDSYSYGQLLVRTDDISFEELATFRGFI